MIKPSTTRLSTKGQVVIPVEIRQRLGLEPGDRFAVIGEGDVVILKALQPIDPAEFEELLAQARACQGRRPDARGCGGGDR